MKKLLLLTLITISLNLLLAGNIDILEKANQAYQDNDYKTALNQFLAVANEGISNSDLYYNIGNSYYRNGELGNAILYMKKSLKLESSHEKAKLSLEFLLTQTKDKQSIGKTDPISKFSSAFFDTVSINFLAILSLVLFALVILTIHIIIHHYNNRDRAVPYFIITVLVVLLIPTIILSSYKFDKMNNQNDAVLLADTTIGYSGPSTEFTRVFTIHEGMLLEIEKNQNGWSLVKLSNGIGGWISQDSFALVKN